MRSLALTRVGLIAFAVVWSTAAWTSVQAQSAKSKLTDPVLANRFNAVSERLVCQCGCGMGLRVCNHFECPSATPMRAKIEEDLLAGMSDDAIVATFVEEYGDVVLATPPAEGFNLAAWVMPGFAVLVGLFLVFYFVADWLAKKKVKPGKDRKPADPLLTARIEQELKGMDG
jgi:cytochrome c-type biogenesis protein CcmH